MYKEIIISFIIALIVILGDIVTLRYTKKIIKELCIDSQNLKQALEEKNIEEIENNLKDLEEHIKKVHQSLAYYIEHDEIEKVETTFTECKSYANYNQFEMAINKLDRTVFVLEHIEDKYAFNLENIF